MPDFPGKGKVAVLKTSPETVLDDIEALMKLAEVEKALPKGVTTGLKINISWQNLAPPLFHHTLAVRGCHPRPEEFRVK